LCNPVDVVRSLWFHTCPGHCITWRSTDVIDSALTMHLLALPILILAYTSHRFVQAPGPGGVLAAPRAAAVDEAIKALLAGSERLIHLPTAGGVLLGNSDVRRPDARARARAIWDQAVKAGSIPPRADPTDPAGAGPALVIPVAAEDSDSD